MYCYHLVQELFFYRLHNLSLLEEPNNSTIIATTNIAQVQEVEITLNGGTKDGVKNSTYLLHLRM
jgi:hypothetical protein